MLFFIIFSDEVVYFFLKVFIFSSENDNIFFLFKNFLIFFSQKDSKRTDKRKRKKREKISDCLIGRNREKIGDDQTRSCCERDERFKKKSKSKNKTIQEKKKRGVYFSRRIDNHNNYDGK